MIHIISEGNLFTSFCSSVAGTASFLHLTVTALFQFFIQSVLFLLVNFNLFAIFVGSICCLYNCNRCMQQWDRDTSGRLNRISTQLDPASEVSVPTDTLDPIPDEQQSQPGTPMNPNAYRTMRDHIHPPRVSAPSCIIPPADDVAVRPYLVPLLPTYHGMENENPYTHLRDF